MSGCVLWVSGLPASGKSTLAGRVAAELRARQTPCCTLDGDDVRALLDPPPGYGDVERDRFYAFLARLAAHLAGQGLAVLVPATAHRRRWRDAARQLAPRFFEVWIAATPAECRARDSKGLYRRADRGEIDALPGVGVDFERPARPDVVARSGHDAGAVAELVRLVAGT